MQTEGYSEVSREKQLFFCRRKTYKFTGKRMCMRCSFISIKGVYVTGFDKSRLGRTHQANPFSTTNR